MGLWVRRKLPPTLNTQLLNSSGQWAANQKKSHGYAAEITLTHEKSLDQSRARFLDVDGLVVIQNRL